VTELALDDKQRHTLARHFDRMRVSQLMRRKRLRTPARPHERRRFSALAVADQDRAAVQVQVALSDRPW